jgi:hypothetical protein
VLIPETRPVGHVDEAASTVTGSPDLRPWLPDPVLPDPARVPRVGTFFAHYPETLGLRDGETFCVALKAPLRGFARAAMHLREGEPPFWLDPALSHLLAVSARFHRGKRQRDIITEHDETLMSVIQSVAGESFPDFKQVPQNSASDPPEEPADRNASDGMEYTVVEMTTQIAMPVKSHWEACEPNDYIMGPTLTRCIDGLIQVVDAYLFAEKISVPRPARERLGPAIVGATRPADPDQGGWDTPAQYIINHFATQSGQHFVVGTQTPATLQEMYKYLVYASLGHPSIALGQLQADLNNALYHTGNFRAVLMFAHSASEILMDTALMAMLFDEGKTAQEAVASFARPLKTRILTEYHDRLGGAWTPQGSNAVAVWLRNVLMVRHLVVHAGYSPHYEEARLAREAHFSLGQHLRDRLAARAKQYPFAAGLLVRTGGFERRGTQTKAAEAAVRAEADRLEEFVAWRNDLIRLRASGL